MNNLISNEAEVCCELQNADLYI